MRNLEVLKKQGRELLDQRRDEFVRQSLLSDDVFFDKTHRFEIKK